MKSRFAAILVFLVGLAGYIALLMGLAYWSLPAAMIIGGLLAIWWSWYISIGIQLQMTKQTKMQGSS